MTAGTDLYLLQLAGPPGAGKSRLAAALAGRCPAVILNSDVLKSALLDAGVPWKLAGPAAYQAMGAQAGDLLAQGRSVILDSPSHYPHIPERGQRVARAHGARYRFIELACPDLDELHRRLAGRMPLRSQMPALGQPPADGTTRAARTGTHQWQTTGPDGGWLILDCTRPFEDYLAQAAGYAG